jgi:hypothetical protein
MEFAGLLIKSVFTALSSDRQSTEHFFDLTKRLVSWIRYISIKYLRSIHVPRRKHTLEETTHLGGKVTEKKKEKESDVEESHSRTHHIQYA